MTSDTAEVILSTTGKPFTELRLGSQVDRRAWVDTSRRADDRGVKVCCIYECLCLWPRRWWNIDSGLDPLSALFVTNLIQPVVQQNDTTSFV